MKKHYGLLLFLIPLFLSSILGVGQAINYSYHENLTLTRDIPIWSDSQWKYYEQTVGYEDFLEVNISYGGGLLDIDMRAFLAIDLQPWDITREGIEKGALDKMIANSQNRGTTSWEYVRYDNTAYPEGMTVYVLMFVYDGMGSSEITINSNKELIEDSPGIGGFLGFILQNIILVVLAFGLAMFGLIMLMNYYRKKYKRYIEEQKDKMAKEKLGNKAAKY